MMLIPLNTAGMLCKATRFFEINWTKSKVKNFTLFQNCYTLINTDFKTYDFIKSYKMFILIIVNHSIIQESYFILYHV